MSRHLSRFIAQIALLARITGLTRFLGRVRGDVRARLRAIRQFSLIAWIKDLPNLVIRYGLHMLAAAGLIYSMGGQWQFAADANASPKTGAKSGAITSTSAVAGEATTPGTVVQVDDYGRPRTAKKEPTGKLNLNTATEEQLMLLPTVGPSKAERIVTWRKKNGTFRRTADLRRVKGFGYKTFKKLEPYLDIKGDTTLAAKQR